MYGGNKMVSKNNRKLLIEKNREEKQRFSIRKLSVGAASVLVGLTFSAYSGQTAQAATENNPVQSTVKEETNQNKDTQSAVQADKSVTKPAENLNGGGSRAL